MIYIGQNGSKNIGLPEINSFKNIGNQRWYIQKSFFQILPIEMRYTGRNGSKNTGLPEIFSFKNIGNQRGYIQKAI